MSRSGQHLLDSALVAEARLHGDEDVAEIGPLDEDFAPVGQVLARGRTPRRLDLLEVRLAPDVVVHRDLRGDVGVGAVAVRIAHGDPLAQVVHRLRQLDVVAALLERLQRVVQRRVDREIRGRARGPRVGREVEQDDGDVALARRRLAQPHQPGQAVGEGAHALGLGVHVALVLHRRRGGPPAEEHGAGRAVQLGDGDHDRGFDREQAEVVVLPLLERLELGGLRRDVGDVQLGQHILRRAGVVERRPADQREAGQGDHGVHAGLAVVHEEALHRGPGIQPGGEGGDGLQPARLQRRDHRVVVRRVAGEHIGAHDQHAHAPARIALARKLLRLRRDASLHARVVQAGLGILFGVAGVERAPQMPARAVGVAVDQEAHHVGEVRLRARQHVLQRQEIRPDVLRRTRDVAQDLGDPAQHGDLLLARALAALVAAAQVLEQLDRPARGRAVHGELAHARQAHDLAGGHGAHQRVAIVPARLQVRDDRLHLILGEEHRGDHDVALRDVFLRALEQLGIAVPLRRRVKRQAQTGQLLAQRLLRLLGGTGEVRVERDDDDADRRRVRS